MQGRENIHAIPPQLRRVRTGSRAAAFRLFCRNRQRCGIPAARAAGFRRDERRTKALNSALGVTATLKYPASGDFLSPLLFGDWDGDGQDEAAVLYTLDASAGNVYLAILEPTEENGWRVTQTAEGLSSEVERREHRPSAG